MSGGFRTRIARPLAVGVGLVMLLGGGVYALISRDDGGGWSKQFAGASATTSVTTVPRSSSTGPTSTSTSTSTTTSTVPEETTTTAAASRQESFGSVRELQQKLADLGYDIGPIDGVVGGRTYYTIMAFQKVEGLPRTGEDSAALREALANASTPGPMVPGGEATRVEIDLDRQVLFLWQGGSLARILSVSTGNGEYYCVDGECDTAITPTGSFRIGRKARGLEVSRLGELYDPMYFYGGIAIHGSPSIPGYPASHGCVRVPMYASPTLFDQVPAGTRVHVVGDGPPAAVVEAPPDEPIVQEPAAPPPAEEVPTTTTTVPETTTTTTPTIVTAPESTTTTTSVP